MPFDSMSIGALQNQILTQEPDYSMIKDRSLVQLIKMMLIKDPCHRANIQDVLNHKWITYFDQKETNSPVVAVLQPPI